MTAEVVARLDEDLARGPTLRPVSVDTWGQRLGLLVDRGQLDEPRLERLLHELAGGRTLPADSDETPATVEDVEARAPLPPSIAAWERYRVLRLLGAGGGGQVWRAWDPRLERTVALKFLWAESATMAERFKQEAQAQARIEHEHVCKVYEVGEVDGRAYIAMQFIDGVTLGEAAATMTLEEKLRLVSDVASALHAAHRLGLIHRDCKPGNVMVERDDEGRRRAWVMDFGLARATDGTATLSGGVVGTPQYMAPEQVRGETQLDRRTDVYGLGATLYDVLAGQPPVSARSAAQALVQSIVAEVRPLRALVPSLPRDLETIVMKCLERDPGRRYATARALADDLERFLDGEPIAARPVSRMERLWRRARKQPALVATVGVALLGLSTLGAVAVQSRRHAAEGARVARELGQEVERIEASLRIAHLLPAHDTRADRAELRARMGRIEEQIKRIGPVAVGPGSYALGVGHLLLDEPREARTLLERAWAEGYRQPEAAVALGRVLGEIYDAANIELSTFSDEDRRARAPVVAALREEALRYLRTPGAPQGRTYVEGLIAYYAARDDDALALARRSSVEEPWRYEADMLAASVYENHTERLRARGDYDGAARALDAAEASWERAMEVGRSDEAGYVGACQNALLRVKLAVSRGRTVEDAGRAGGVVCARAVAIAPDSARAYLWKSKLEVDVADVRLDEDQSADGLAERAVDDGRTAVRLEPRISEAQVALGNALALTARIARKRGLDSRPLLEEAATVMRRAVALRATRNPCNNLAVIDISLASVAIERAEDPRPFLDDAERALVQAGTADPEAPVVPANFGTVERMRGGAAVARGEDPRPYLERAAAHLERALVLNPRHAGAHANLARVLEERADWEREHHVDPSPSEDRAREHASAALAIAPSDDATSERLVRLEVHAAERAADSRPALGRASELLAALLRTDGSDVDYAVLHCRIETLTLRSDGSPAERARARATAELARRLAAVPPVDAADVEAARKCSEDSTRR